MKITKAVLPIAGLGTRLLPATKEQPKAMLPVFDRGSSGELCVKPLLQMIFEQLFSAGIREFFFIVGRDKRIIQSHFTPDRLSASVLAQTGKVQTAENLRSLYNMIDSSEIVWIDQPKPSGFGHAVLMAEPYVGDDNFIVHAGDTYLLTKEGLHMKKCLDRSGGADIMMIVKRVMHPERFGVIRSKLSGGEHIVLEAIEKPKKFVSNLAIMPVYSFSSSIFEELEVTSHGTGGEIQLTDGIQRAIEKGRSVSAVELPNDSLWVDVGTPESYWEAQELTHNLFSSQYTIPASPINEELVPAWTSYLTRS